MGTDNPCLDTYELHPGDLVELVYWGDAYNTYRNWPGLVGVDHNYVHHRPFPQGEFAYVRVVAPHSEGCKSTNIYLVRTEQGLDHIVGRRGIRLVKSASLDLAHIKHTRAGWPVANVEKTGDPRRPYRAEVFVAKEWMTLTFGPSGHFYSHIDQPVDLVEAK